MEEEFSAKLERLEERYVFEEITQSQYGKFRQRLGAEKLEIEEKLHSSRFNLSNLEKALDLGLIYAKKLPELWQSGNLDTKRSLQRMLFPEGILYDFKNSVFRTPYVNSIFSCIGKLSKEMGRNKKRDKSKF